MTTTWFAIEVVNGKKLNLDQRVNTSSGLQPTLKIWGTMRTSRSSCLMTSPTTSTQLTDFLCRPSWKMRTSSAELRPLWWQPQVRLRQAMPSTSSRRMSRARFIRVLDLENHNQGQDRVQSPRWAQEVLMMMEFHRKNARRIQAQERQRDAPRQSCARLSTRHRIWSRSTRTSRLKLKNLLAKSTWYGKSTQDVDDFLRKSTSWKVAQPGSSELNKAGTSQGQKTESPSSSCWLTRSQMMFISLQDAVFGALCKSSQQAEVKKLDSFWWFLNCQPWHALGVRCNHLQDSTTSWTQCNYRTSMAVKGMADKGIDASGWIFNLHRSVRAWSWTSKWWWTNDEVVLPVKKPTCLLTTRRNLFYCTTCWDLHALATINTHRVKATFRDKVFVLHYVKIIPMRWPMNWRTAWHSERRLSLRSMLLKSAEDGDAELLEFVSWRRRLEQERSTMSPDWGHPSPEVLVKMLTEVQATENVLQAAREYVCRNCFHRANHFKYHPLEESLQLLLAIAWWWTLHGFSWRQDVNVSSLCVMKQLAILPSASCRARSPLSLSRAWSALGCVTLDCPSTCE